ncbi:lactonase family protein [Psychromonas hadalis]|uniref:lactonase family protein n=1 Tax=Psychromonas hadalis TaxID=211669 RepID=UPI0003B682AE|nr:lactonase family protein [Psychromonas hadalis]
MNNILYIGSYTPNNNAGITVAEFNHQNGQLVELKTISELPDTSFLAVTKDKSYLLAVSEHDVNGELGCFDINDPKSPRFINKQSTLGGSPCHINLSANKAFVSNYGSGNVSAFSLTENKLLPAYADVQHQGQGGDLQRQASAHAHASQLSVDEQFLVVADLGIDALKVYRVSEKQLSLVFSASLPAGAGPRHLTFNMDGDKLYLGNELNSEVTVFAFNPKKGELDLLQTISSLPNDNQTESYIAEVTLSNDGGYLYVSNRGHDSIAIFSVDAQTGLLTVVTLTETGGLFPRHFVLSPDQNWLLVAHQNSDYLTVFKRDNCSGLLTKTDNKLAVKHAVCLCFLEG